MTTVALHIPASTGSLWPSLQAPAAGMYLHACIEGRVYTTSFVCYIYWESGMRSSFHRWPEKLQRDGGRSERFNRGLGSSHVSTFMTRSRSVILTLRPPRSTSTCIPSQSPSASDTLWALHCSAQARPLACSDVRGRLLKYKRCTLRCRATRSNAVTSYHSRCLRSYAPRSFRPLVVHIMLHRPCTLNVFVSSFADTLWWDFCAAVMHT